MYRSEGVLALLALYVGLTHSFSWDVVMAGRFQLEFYDNNGTRTYTAVIPANSITSLAYDPVHNRVLFVDETLDDFSICSYNIATKEILILFRSDKSEHARIAHDPGTQLLFFWSEPRSKIINSISSKPGYTNAVQQNLFIEVDESIKCITVDNCGYIYWSTDNKIERVRFDGSEREVVIGENVFVRGGISIDHQAQKMYWLDIGYYGAAGYMTIESADLNGENRRTLYSEPTNTTVLGPLLVSKDFTYWRTENTFSQLSRNPPHDEEVEPKIFLVDQSWSLGMASNYKLEDETQRIQNCEAQKRLLPINSETNDCASRNVSTDVSLSCIHGTKVNGESRCECTQGYIGERCEVSVCHNYCFQGDCIVSAEGQPKCRCNASYSGERCEVSVCQNYCFQGDCSANAEGQPKCRCKAGYSGERCKVNACHEYCSNNGICSLNEESEPVCKCTRHYEGKRCDVPVFLVKTPLLRDILNTDVTPAALGK